MILTGFLLTLSKAEEAANQANWNKPLTTRSPLVVGATSDSFPYGYLGANGEWEGFSVEIANAVAHVMNLPIKRVAANGRDLQQRFQKGEFDFLQSLSQTDEREAYAEFSVPFLTLQGAIFIQKTGSPIKRLEDLNGRKFAVVGNGSIGQKFLQDHHLNVQPIYVSSSEEALRLIERGECVATFMSMLTGLSITESRHIGGTTVFGQPFENYDIRHCFAVHRGDAILLARLNEGLAILHRTGEFQRIYQRWFGRYTQPLISRDTLIAGGGIILAIAFIGAFAAFLWQRNLHGRISRQAEELAGQQQLLQALYDNLPFVMCVLEGDSDNPRVLSLNRQGEPYFGLAARQAVGRLIRELPLETEWNRHLLDLLKCSPNHAGFVREERSLSSARKRFVFSLIPLAPGPGDLSRICLLAEDITERRALDDEIAQSRKLRAIGELVGGIAHEFNNLLTPIMLKTSEIKLDWPHDHRLHEEISIITSAGHRGAELTRRLLAFGRKGESRIETVSLATVVDQAFALMRLTLDRRMEWHNGVSRDLPPIHLNVTDLNQVLANLILNARDTLLDKLAHQREGWTPKITVEASAEPLGTLPVITSASPRVKILGWQRLTVRDNGMGMDTAVRERVFEPFFTTKDIGKGTGLGLATVWHIVQEAGGRIEIESAVGKGSAFHLWLPVTPTPSPAAKVDSNVAPTVSTQARIFVADDDELVARTVTTVLQRLGHSVHRVADGSIAWQYLQEKHAEFDLLILDVNMPGLDGIELAHRARTKLNFSGKIMIISGRLSSNDLREISQARVDNVLTKPFAISDFIRTIEGCLTGERKKP